MSEVELYTGDCAQVMAERIETASIDLIVTSPPYWNQRAYSFWPQYDDYMADVARWISEAARVLKPGRHCFWVIPDKLPWPPKENGTGERLYMPIYADTERRAADAGFTCEFPIVWCKPHGTRKMFGSYPYPPTVIHTPMTERICVWRKPGAPDNRRKSHESRFSKEQWVAWAKDTWDISPQSNSKHPAPFPIELPTRILTLWSFVGDTVLDPFVGSGTTGEAAILLKRRFIGIDIAAEYVELARQRIGRAQSQLHLSPL